MVTACVAMNKLTEIVDQEVGESSETSYAAIDAERSGIICQRPVGFTLDYVACRQTVYWYNGTFLSSDLLAPVGLNAYEQVKTTDIQSEAAVQASQGGVEGQTAALDAQRRTFKLKSNVETTKAALEGTKALSMFGNLMMYPTPKIVAEEWCSNNSNNPYNLDHDLACALSYAANINTQTNSLLFANTQMKGKFLGVGATALAKGIVSAIVAKSYRDQARMVGEVAEDLENAAFNQEENQLDFGSEFCKQHPDSPSCGGSAGRVPTTTGVDFNFDNNGLTGGTDVDFGTDGDVDSGSGVDTVTGTASGSGTDELAGVLASDSTGGGGNDFSSPGVAKVSATNPQGGGGGGGGAAGGGGGGAAGGGEPRKGKASSGTFGGKVNVAYAKGSSFARGGSVGSKSKSSNLFDNLTNNKRSRNLASQANVNILPKESRLFQTISNRYNAVNKEGGRLLVIKD